MDRIENVVTAVFDVESEAYQALSELKKDPITPTFTISQMGLCKKQNNRIIPLDGFDTGVDTRDDTAKGGLIGSIIGILGGPIGVLLGGGMGALVGSAIDSDDSAKNMSMLERVCMKLGEGQIIMAALIQETDESVFDFRLQKYQTTITRYEAARIACEAEEATKLQKEMAKEAKRKLREEKKEKWEQAVSEKRAKIQADFETFKKNASQK